MYGQGSGDGDHGDIIHSELMCPKLATKVVAFWKTHPLAEAAGVSLCGSEGETIVVESLDDRTRRWGWGGRNVEKQKWAFLYVRPVYTYPAV